jgi:hypothetical protein
LLMNDSGRKIPDVPSLRRVGSRRSAMLEKRLQLVF